MGVIINYDDIPRSWRFCFCEGCPKHEVCLRYQSTQCIPDNLTWGPAVYPTSFRHGDCPHFKQIRVIHAAYGFSLLFRDVKQRDSANLQSQMKAYLGGHGTYYRYNRGEKLLTPEQQQWILNLFTRYGYTENLAFDNYRDVLDFTD